MKTIPSPHTSDPGKEDTLLTGIQESIYPHHIELNIIDGGEFLDDAIRMKDQPLGEAAMKEAE